jgi:hypothetical protein
MFIFLKHNIISSNEHMSHSVCQGLWKIWDNGYFYPTVVHMSIDTNALEIIIIALFSEGEHLHICN